LRSNLSKLVLARERDDLAAIYSIFLVVGKCGDSAVLHQELAAAECHVHQSGRAVAYGSYDTTLLVDFARYTLGILVIREVPHRSKSTNIEYSIVVGCLNSRERLGLLPKLSQLGISGKLLAETIFLRGNN